MNAVSSSTGTPSFRAVSSVLPASAPATMESVFFETLDAARPPALRIASSASCRETRGQDGQRHFRKRLSDEEWLNWRRLVPSAASQAEHASGKSSAILAMSLASRVGRCRVSGDPHSGRPHPSSLPECEGERRQRALLFRRNER